MKRFDTRRLRLLTACAFAGLVGSTVAREARAAINAVTLSPASLNVSVAQFFTISIAGSSFSQTVDGGGLNLTFNPSLLQVQSVTIDATTWEFFAQNGTIDNVGGHVNEIAFASFAGRTGAFPIASVTFKQIAAGSSQIAMTESTLNPFASGGQHLAVTLSPATVSGSTANVPIGSRAILVIAVLLLALGAYVLRTRASVGPRLT